MDDYWALVQRQNQREEETYLEVSQIVYDELQLTEQVFQDTQQYYLMQREYQNVFYQFQMEQELRETESKRSQRGRRKQRRHSKEEVLQMVEFSENLKGEVIGKMRERGNAEEDPMEEQIHQ